MKGQKKKQNGITLIALVISIIVMLILAGVSLNMTVGDNGIIKQAQNATIQTSVAMLQDFFDQLYVNNFERLEQSDSKITSLMSLPSLSNYFYRPNVGTLKYVVDTDGHALYLIKKSELPKDIKDSLVGGDAGEGTYKDYQSLNDVYGITSDLKVYYSASAGATLVGISDNELDFDNPLREVFPSGSKLATIITGSTTKSLTAEEVKRIDTIELNGSDISELSQLYNLISLKKLTLNDYNGSLSGIENVTLLNSLMLKNCAISDYSPIGKLGGSLQKLYLYNTTDTEVSKLCSKNATGIGKFDLPNLKYFGIVGNLISLDYTSQSNVSDTKSTNTITSTTDLDQLTDTTKSAINYLYLNNNNISSLSGLKNFNRVSYIRCEYNAIKNLDGLQNMTNLRYLIAQNNQLGVDEDSNNKDTTADSLSYLSTSVFSYLDLQNNKIKWINYVKGKSISSLFLLNNPDFVFSSVTDIASLYNSIGGEQKNIDDKYRDYLSTSDYLIYKNLSSAASDSQRLTYLKSLTANAKKEIHYLDLSGSTISDADFTTILSGMTNLYELNCSNCTNLETLDWLNGMTKLYRFLFVNTAITGTEVSKLDTYATGLRAFWCNNQGIDLTKMQLTISRARCSQSVVRIWRMDGGWYW